MDHTHTANNMAKDNEPSKEVIIEDIDEERKTQTEPLLFHSKYHNIHMIFEGSNREKGKNMI